MLPRQIFGTNLPFKCIGLFHGTPVRAITLAFDERQKEQNKVLSYGLPS